jgi:hypothetical protein
MELPYIQNLEDNCTTGFVHKCIYNRKIVPKHIIIDFHGLEKAHTLLSLVNVARQLKFPPDNTTIFSVPTIENIDFL